MIFRPLDWTWEAIAGQQYCNVNYDLDKLRDRVRLAWVLGDGYHDEEEE